MAAPGGARAPTDSVAEPTPAAEQEIVVNWQGTVQLVSKDDKSLEVDSKAAESALTVKRYLQDREQDDDPVCKFPVEKVDGSTLTKLVEYMVRLKDVKDKKAAGMPPSEDDDKAWDKQYLDMPINNLFELMLAGNFMDMPDLLEFTCTYLAGQIRGKTPEQLRELFGVENDFTDEEKAEIAAEPKWDFD